VKAGGYATNVALWDSSCNAAIPLQNFWFGYCLLDVLRRVDGCAARFTAAMAKNFTIRVAATAVYLLTPPGLVCQFVLLTTVFA